MSVIVMTKFPGKASDLERIAGDEHAETLKRMGDEGRSQGCLHHAFVEDTDGNVLVVDEWETEEAFSAFFAAQAANIVQMAADAGVTGPPTSTAYRILDTPDRF
jgi:heme-degrading monooxygenase HmoA